MSVYDTIVIGAGAAGLGCAHRLSFSGKKVLLLEGRGRVGGRILTQKDPAIEAPIELGAEFIHDAPENLMSLINRMGLSFVDAAGMPFEAVNGRLKPLVEFWERVGEPLSRMKHDGGPDRSFADYLAQAEPRIEEEILPFLKTYVEGFHAADPTKISEAGLAEAEQATSEKETPGPRNARLINGYSPMFARLRQECEAAGCEVRLSTVVKEVEWSRGQAVVRGYAKPGKDPVEFRARSVVVTVPIGVLNAGPQAEAGIAFKPEPEQLREAVQAITMGPIVRIVFRTKTRFWENLELPSEDWLHFLHAGPDHEFPTWWTPTPMRVPLLIAWQGGPRAQMLASLSEDEIVERALTTLSYMIGLSKSEMRREIEGWYMHNWVTDPFSLGAYSYINVGGVEAARRFGTPIDDTLFFAGEATISGSARGTVNGAMESGEAAAEGVLKALGR